MASIKDTTINVSINRWNTGGDLVIDASRDVTVEGLKTGQTVEGPVSALEAIDENGSLNEGYIQEILDVEILAGEDKRTIGIEQLTYYYKINNQICDDPNANNYGREGDCVYPPEKGLPLFKPITLTVIATAQNQSVCDAVTEGLTQTITVWYDKRAETIFDENLYVEQGYENLDLPEYINLSSFSFVRIENSGIAGIDSSKYYRISSTGIENNQQTSTVYYIISNNPVSCEAETKKLNKIIVQIAYQYTNQGVGDVRNSICNSTITREFYVEKDLNSSRQSFSNTILYSDEQGKLPITGRPLQITIPSRTNSSPSAVTANVIKLASGTGFNTISDVFYKLIQNRVIVNGRSYDTYVVSPILFGTCTIDDDINDYTDCEARDRNISPEDLGRDQIVCEGIIYVWDPTFRGSGKWVPSGDNRGGGGNGGGNGGGGDNGGGGTSECQTIISQNISPIAAGLTSNILECNDIRYYWNGNIWIEQRDVVRG